MRDEEYHYEKVTEYLRKSNREGRVLVTASYGSQNYNVDTEDSDLDTKSIYVPTVEECVLGLPWVNKELHLENEEHAEVKDVRFVTKEFLKNNVNYLEVLKPSKAVYTSHKDMDSWNRLYLFTDTLVAANPSKMLDCVVGMAKGYLKNKSSFEGKTTCNVYRLLRFVEKFYVDKEPFFKALRMDDDDAELCRKYKKQTFRDFYLTDHYMNDLKLYQESLKKELDLVDRNEDYKKAKNVLDNFVLQTVMKGEFLG